MACPPSSVSMSQHVTQRGTKREAEIRVRPPLLPRTRALPRSLLLVLQRRVLHLGGQVCHRRGHCVLQQLLHPGVSLGVAAFLGLHLVRAAHLRGALREVDLEPRHLHDGLERGALGGKVGGSQPAAREYVLQQLVDVAQALVRIALLLSYTPSSRQTTSQLVVNSGTG